MTTRLKDQNGQPRPRSDMACAYERAAGHVLAGGTVEEAMDIVMLEYPILVWMHSQSIRRALQTLAGPARRLSE
jgi:hypothetical protein